MKQDEKVTREEAEQVLNAMEGAAQVELVQAVLQHERSRANPLEGRVRTLTRVLQLVRAWKEKDGTGMPGELQREVDAAVEGTSSLFTPEEVRQAMEDVAKHGPLCIIDEVDIQDVLARLKELVLLRLRPPSGTR